MGAVYDVSLKILTDKEEGLINSVKKYMETANARFNDKWKPNSIDNIAKIFLAEHQKNFAIIGKHEYESSFDASYGWEGILYELWETIKPYLNKGSYIKVYPDSGYWIEEV